MFPTQSRMARAGLGWSIERAAEAAGVGTNTISRLENEQEIGAESAQRLLAAFAAAGVSFRDQPDALCVCIEKPAAVVFRRPAWVPAHDYIAVGIAVKERKLVVFVGRDLLDDLDRWGGNRRSEEKLLASFERSRALILQAAATAVAKDKVTPDNRIYLTPEHFPKHVF